jgi:DNA processing protein
LLELLGPRIDEIFRMSDSELLELRGVVTSQVLEGIKKQRSLYGRSRKFAEEQITRMRQGAGGIVLLDDDMYPKFLRNSKMCHPILFWKGNLMNLREYERSIAIVGSRSATKRSLKLAGEVARELSQRGWVIVSGMAKGIDAAAHQGALEVKGKTIAVQGGGVDVPYPPESKSLYAKILEENLIVSEYPFGTRPQALNLKKRNKTTVAFSLGAFVVQTAKDGGAMNAVIACKEQNKPIFTIRGKGKDFSGNKEIIKGGGIEVTVESAADRIVEVCSNLAIVDRPGS